MLDIPEMVSAITTRAEGRYEVFTPESVELAPLSDEFTFAVIQLKRANQEMAGWRTILITALPFDAGKIQQAFRWAADVRDTLAEPQTSDLYMFMLIEGIASEDAARLETDDRFCRKIVVREQEDVESFLDRSFLATLTPASTSGSISDPLSAAMGALVAAHTWVEPHHNTWREILLSGQSGSEIANSLAFAAFSDEGDA